MRNVDATSFDKNVFLRYVLKKNVADEWTNK